MIRRFLLGCWLCGACSVCFAQSTPTEPLTPIKAIQEETTFGLEFKLDPVALEVSEELERAKEAYTEGKWQFVIDSLTEFLTDYPGDNRFADALFLRAESLVQLERYTEARRDFKQLLTRQPHPTQKVHADFRIAESTMLLGEQQEAQRQLESFRAAHPQHELNAYVIPYLAETVAKNGNTAWSAGLYSETLERFPNGPLTSQARLRLALLKYQNNEFQSANNKLFQFVESADHETPEYWTANYWLAMTEFKTEKWKAAADRLTSFVETKPNHEFAASATYHAAEAYRRIKQPKRALSLLNDLRQRWPNSPLAMKAQMSEMQIAKFTGDSKRVFELYSTFEGNKEETRDATRIAVEMLLSEKRFEEANELIEPIAQRRSSLVTQEGRNKHYTDLFLYAMARRGLGKYGQANQLLGRIRLDLVDQTLSERIMLARAETANAAKDYNAAVEQGFQYEARFPNGQYLDAIRAEMVIGMIGANRRDEAKIKFRQLTRTEGDQKEIARAARRLGEASYRDGDLQNAREVFTALQAAKQSEDDLAQARSGLAWVAMKQGDLSAAIDHFEQFIASFPGHPSTPSCRLALAQAFVTENRRDDAIKVLKFFVDLSAAEPTRAKAMYQLAELMHRDESLLEESREVVDQLLAEHEAFELRDAALYLSGIIQRRLDLDSADDAFTELIEQHKTSKFWSDALYRLAESAESMEKQNEAKQYLTKLISAEQDRKVLPHALYMMGRLESDAKNWTEARETLRDLLRKFPQSPLVPVARYGVAESFYQEKQYDRSLQLFEILNQNKRFEDGDAWGAMVQLRRAQLLVEKDDLASAIAVAKKIEEDFPNFSLQHEADYLLGRAYASRGDFRLARASYAKVMASDHDRDNEITPMAQWMTGETYFHQKQYILAIKAYEALVSDTSFPKWQAASYLQIGKCYESLGNPDQAKKAYSRVTNRFPQSRYVEEAKQRMQVLDQ